MSRQSEDYPMETYGKWIVVKELGKGGQGTVYLAQDTSKFNIEALKNMIVRDIPQTLKTAEARTKAEAAGRLAQTILEFGTAESPKHCGALKVIHRTRNDAEYRKQLDRMKKELAALRDCRKIKFTIRLFQRPRGEIE